MYYISHNLVFSKGYRKTLIIDLYRNNIETVPNTFYDFIIRLVSDRMDLKEIKLEESYYLEYCIKKEYILFKEYEMPEDLYLNNFNYTLPNLISNAILEFNSLLDIENAKFIIKQLTKTDTKYIEIRIYKCTELIEVINFIELVDLKYFDLVEFYINLQFNLSIDNMIIDLNSSKLNRTTYFNFVFYSKNFEQTKKRGYNFEYCVIRGEFSNISCGKVSKQYFSIHHEAVKESINHNSCLHKKLSVDVNGNIKNCPSMKESFGNIKDTTLSEAIEKPGFKKY